MDSRDPHNNKDPPPNLVGGGTTPKATPRTASKQTADVPQALEVVNSRVEKTTTSRTEFTSTKITKSSKSSSCEQYDEPDSPGQSLRQKVAQLEKVWSSGGGMKRNSEQTPDELRRDVFFSTDDDDSFFEIDVFEIEKRLREERQRGLAEAESAKLDFQQVHLRATPEPTTAPQRVEIREEHAASPFNVTLKTSTKLSPGAEINRLPEPPSSPFNVTLRTRRRKPKDRDEKPIKENSAFNVTLRTSTDAKAASAQFLANEKSTVREVQTADGIRTIVTSSMTSDGRHHEEKIFRHGAGYVSPSDTPQRAFDEREGSISRSISSYSSGRSSATPPRSVDMTAGGRRILIKLDDDDNMDIDETDYVGRQAADSLSSGDVAMGTYANIDIKVGTSGKTYSQEQEGSYKNQVTVETTPPQQQIIEIPWQRSNKTITTTMKTSTITTSSSKTQNSTFSSNKKSETELEQVRKNLKFVAKGENENNNNNNGDDDESETEGIAASKVVIVPVNEKLLKEESGQLNASFGRNFGLKGLNNSYQQISPTSTTTTTATTTETTTSNEFQDLQTTMAAKSYTRSNSQYDSHIRELRGN